MKNGQVLRQTNTKRTFRDEGKPLIVVGQEGDIILRAAQALSIDGLIDYALRHSNARNKYSYLIVDGRTLNEKGYDKVVRVGIVGNYDESKPSLGNVCQLFSLFGKLSAKHGINETRLISESEYFMDLMDKQEIKRGRIYSIDERNSVAKAHMGLDECISNMRNELYLERIKVPSNPGVILGDDAVTKASEILDKQRESIEKLRGAVA